MSRPAQNTRQAKPVSGIKKVAALRRPNLRILFIHSDAASVERCLQELRNVHFHVSVEVALTPEQFTERLRSQCFDVVLAEYPSPNWDGTQALDLLQQTETQNQLPLIFITDRIRT